MQSVFEILQMLNSQGMNREAMLDALSVMADPPGEEFQPNMKLPERDGIASYNVAQPGLGSAIAGREYSVPAPLFGEELAEGQETIGQLILGDDNGNVSE